jgi:hypothetical protein
MAVKYFIKAAVSEFKGDDGSMKKRYQTIGIVMETKHGLMLKIESLPMFAMKEGSILAYLNEPEEKGANLAPASKAVDLSDLESDIPF